MRDVFVSPDCYLLLVHSPSRPNLGQVRARFNWKTYNQRFPELQARRRRGQARGGQGHGNERNSRPAQGTRSLARENDKPSKKSGIRGQVNAARDPAHAPRADLIRMLATIKVRNLIPHAALNHEIKPGSRETWVLFFAGSGWARLKGRRWNAFSIKITIRG